MRFTILFLVLAAACTPPSNGVNGVQGTTGATCSLQGVDARCGTDCTGGVDCGTALYCGAEGRCVADCVDSTNCAPGLACSGGRCVDVLTGGQSIDAGPTECARVEVKAEPVVPTVVLLLDQSGSMNELISGQTRWNALKNALINPTTGVVPKMDGKVRFASTLYSRNAPTCPALVNAKVDVMTSSQITTQLTLNNPLTDTPTGESIDAVVAELKKPARPAAPGPTVILLATDGNPDTCAAPDSNGSEPPRKLSVEAMQRAYAAGFPGYILSIGDEITDTHLQHMANAGQGLATMGAAKAPFYKATTAGGLVDAFNKIIRGTRSCTFKLNAQVDAAQASNGEAKLNGAVLKYDDANGWSLIGSDSIELKGEACTTFRNSDSATVAASFPCGVAAIN